MTGTLPQLTPLSGTPRQRRRWARASRWQRLRWRGEVLLLRLLLALLRGRRHSAVRRGIEAVVPLARPLLRRRLDTASSNLERVYGAQLTGAERQWLARRSLEGFLLSCLESIIEPVAAERIHAEGEGLEQLLAARRPGQGVIVASLHLGCWDLGLRWLSERIDDLAVIYRPARNPDADRLLNATRSANSRCTWISQFDLRAMLVWLRQGGALVVMTDLYAHNHPLTVDVLGLNTRVVRTPLALSQKTGAPLFPVAQVREDDGDFRLIFGPALPPQSGEAGLAAQAQALADWQEPWIQSYADQYYWIQRRWRSGDGSGVRLRALEPPARRVLAAARPQA